MSAASVAQQRKDIARVQSAVWGKIPTLKAKPGKSKPFGTIPFMALEVDAAELEALAGQSVITSIEEDTILAPTLTESVPLVGGTAAWSSGYTGAGQTVAILDTGVDQNHPFLTGKVVSEACYSTNDAVAGASSLCPGGVTQSTGAGSAMPYAGSCPAGKCDHGTHVAGIAAGNEASFSGVAKDASLIAIQVFTKIGSTSVGAYTSDINLALERVYLLRGTFSIAAVNMSLGGGAYSDQASCDTDRASTKTAIDNLRSVNIATVIASGNNGYTSQVSAPGCISTAVSVGATTKADVVDSYSNSASFLNLLAPGSSINSSIPGGAYAVYNGTSMATPHVVGAWAILKQKTPNITVTDALNALASTGHQVTDSRNGITKPRIQIDAALNYSPNTPPALGYSVETGYGTDGVSPNSGTASTTFSYKVIYTDISNIAPGTIRTCIDGTCYSMSKDTGAADPALRDNVYTNGEQYIYTTTLAAGTHSYYFDAAHGALSVALPVSGALSGPTASDLAINTTTLPDGVAGSPYSATVMATGGTTPYIWSASGLPSGLSINSSTGVISGTPTQAGTIGFTVTVSDTTGVAFSKIFLITIPDIVAPTVPTGLVANAFSATRINLSWTASTDNAGVTIYKIYRDGVQLGTPAGTSFSDTGLTAATTYSYTVSACDAAGNCSAQSSAASATTLATPSAGSVAAWGWNNYGQTTVPAGLSGVTAIDAGWYYTAALKNDGTVVSWGDNTYGQVTIPAGLNGVTAIAVGGGHTVALKNDGTLAAWGYNTWGQTVVPAGLNGVVAIAAGGSHTVALKNDGTVVAWGYNTSGQTTVPAGLNGVIAVAAGGAHTVALKNDGTLVIWGNNTYGQTIVPAGLSGVVAIAAGGYHTVALKNDGTVVAWGYNTNGQTTVPAGLSGVAAIAAGNYHTVVLKNDGTVMAWGQNTNGQTTVPAGLSGVTAITAGGYHTVALFQDNVPPTVPTGLTASAASTSQINLSWGTSTDISGVAGYKVFRDGVQVGNPAGISFNDTGLMATTTYSYTVMACDGAGNCSAQSDAVSATTPAPDTTPPSVPAGLTASAPSAAQINLAWTASTDNLGVAGYKVYRGGVQVGTPAGTSFNDTGLTAATTYSYTVAACDAAGNCSAQSSPPVLVVTPLGPINPSDDASLYTCTGCNPVSNGGYLTVSGYIQGAVKFPTTSISGTVTQARLAVNPYSLPLFGTTVDIFGFTSSSGLIDVTAANAGTYLGTMIIPGNIGYGQDIYFDVTAFVAANASAPYVGFNLRTQDGGTDTFSSIEYNNGHPSQLLVTVTAVPDLIPPAVPTGLTASVADTGQINLSWAASNDNIVVTGYKVYRNGVQVGTPAGTFFIDSGLTPAATYGYTVAACDASANCSLQSAAVTATTGAATPMMAAGSAHTVARHSDGTVLTWGYNSAGQLGDGTTTQRASPALVPGLSGVIAVSAAGADTIALKSDGTVMAWGGNVAGQLGDGTTITRWSPVVVPGLSGVAALDAGPNHTVAVKLDGAVSAWGLNSDGQLGDGSTANRLSPTLVPGLTGVVAVAAGSVHTVVLKSDGTVLTWGSNSSGQLGDGTTTSRLSPVVVAGLTGVVAVAAGNFYSAALKYDGTVVAWGDNTNGQLGNGTTTRRLSPTVVPGVSGVVAIAAGTNYMLALKSDGTVIAWGYNNSGQLGDGTTIQRLSPVVVPGVSGIAAIATNYQHTLALKSDGSVLAWGYNQYGQLGFGSAAASIYSPAATVGVGGLGFLNLLISDTVAPTVPTGLTASAVSMTQIDLSWAVSTDNVGVAAYKIYRNGVQVGISSGTSFSDSGLTVATTYSYTVAACDASANCSAQTTAVSATTLADTTSPVITVSLPGGTYTSAQSVTLAANEPATIYYTLDGTNPTTASAVYIAPINISATTMLKYFGKDTAGNVSTVQTQTYTIYQPVPGTVTAWGSNSNGQTTVPAGLSGVTAISGGEFHTVALKSDGSVVAWGLNIFGQTTVPAGLSGVAAVAASYLHTLALKSDGSVVAWGDNTYGQATIPAGLSGVVAIDAGMYSSVALKNDGTVVAWGNNSYGQGTVPAGLIGVKSIAAGLYHTLALKSDGTVVAWGRNDYGQMSVPAGLSGVKAVAGGYLHSLALKNDGTVVAWGYNYYGQASAPAGLSGVVAIAAGDYFSLALKSDGTVVAWGYNNYGQTTVPLSLSGVTAISAGGFHSVALVGTIADTTSPTVPSLTASAFSATQINLSWAASTDNVGVTGYKVYRNGALLATLGSVTSYSNTGLASGTTYSYTVAACDAAGNCSAQSAAVSASTLLAAPAVSLSPATLTFANQKPGTTSAAQTVTLTNTGSAALNIGSIIASGDFGQTHTCGATLAAGSSCTLDITFTPSATGTRTGAVTITSDAAGSPDAITLTGTSLNKIRSDYDGDGKADILWRHTTTGQNVIWKSANGTTPQTVATSSNLAWAVKGSGDYDGDGKADILWRNTATGQNTIWKSANVATLQPVSTLANLAWQIAGSGDYNGDGKADILWRHTTTGQNVIWKSANGTTLQTVATIGNLAWAVKGSGDYDGDGKADILWRNTTTGQNVIWKSANAATLQPVSRVANLAWQIAGSGDFDGDGKADILWRNTATGQNVIWKSANGATLQTVATSSNLAWAVKGSGDFDGDGKADILWRNTATGQNVIWKSANGATLQTVATSSNLAWTIVGTEDYDGDGKADILWRNTTTGQNVIWKSANAATQQPVSRVANLAWQVQKE